jgi:hypothetical protein
VRAQVAGRLAHREEPRRLRLRRGLRGPRGAWVGLAVQKAWKNLTIRELGAIAGASLRMSASSANLLAEKETAQLLRLLPSYGKVNQRSLAIGSRSTCLLRIGQPSTDAYRPMHSFRSATAGNAHWRLCIIPVGDCREPRFRATCSNSPTRDVSFD